MPSREGREPLNGALYGVSQLVILVAMIPSFLPKPIRFAIILFAAWVAYKMIFTQTTGDMGGDLGLGSAVLQQLLIGVDFALITPPTDLKNLSDKNETSVMERSFKDRLAWTWSLFINPRGIGWAHEPLYLPQRPSKSMPRWKFAALRLGKMLACILLECVVYVIDASNPGMTTPGMVLSQAPLQWRALGVVCFVIAGASRLTALHAGLSALVVGCGFSSPDRWPEFFGSPMYAWQLRGLWRRFWHQNVRKSVVGCAEYIMSGFPSPTTTSGRLLQTIGRVYIAFFLIGAAHVGGDTMLTGEFGLGAFKLFMLQPVGITAEVIISSLWRRFTQPKIPSTSNGQPKTNGHSNGHALSPQPGYASIGGYGNVGLKGYSGELYTGDEKVPTWIRFVGYGWVICWAIFSVAFMVDPMCSVGMFTDPRVDLQRVEESSQIAFNYSYVEGLMNKCLVKLPAQKPPLESNTWFELQPWHAFAIIFCTTTRYGVPFHGSLVRVDVIWSVLKSMLCFIFCTCGPQCPNQLVPATDTCKSAERIAKLSPIEALKLTSRGPPNSCLVAALADAVTHISPALYPPRVVLSTFLALAEKCKPANRTTWDDISWLFILGCLYKVVNTAFFIELLAQGEDPLVSRIHLVMSSLVDVIWTDRECIKDEGIVCIDLLHCSILTFLGFLHDIPGLQRHFLSGKVFGILCLCWLESTRIDHLNIGLPCRRSSVTRLFLGPLVQNTTINAGEMLRRIGLGFISIGPTDYLISKMNTFLSDETLLDENLCRELDVVRLCVSSLIVLGQKPQYISAGFHLQICHVLTRQLQIGRREGDATGVILWFAPGLLGFTSEIVTRPNYESYFELFRHPIASKTLYLCIEAFTSSNSDERDLLDSFKRWRPLFEDIEHSALCRNEKCDKHGTDQCLDVLRETFERGFAHIGALSCTEKEAGPILQSAIAMWTKTSDLLAVTETTVRERMKLLRKCCNFKCTQAYQMHRQKRYRCVNCETVYYCNRNCQKEDWPTHKPFCDPQYFATWDRLQELYKPDMISPSSACTDSTVVAS